MAAPHVAGAARSSASGIRPGRPRSSSRRSCSPATPPGRAGRLEARTTREGGGRINLPRADDPLVFALAATAPSASCAPAGDADAPDRVTDAGSGAGPWTVAVVRAIGAAAPRSLASRRR